MNNNTLPNNTHKKQLDDFEKHLQTLNYSEGTVRSCKSNLKEFFAYLQEQNKGLKDADTTMVNNYFAFLQKRANYRRDGGLKATSLNKQKHALTTFFDFLIRSGENIQLPLFPSFQKQKYVPTVLTTQDVERLFKACENTIIGRRNAALLALYYGCGLRRKEGTCLSIQDIDLDKQEIFIRQSKTHKQRKVPFSGKTKELIEDYIFNAREILIPSDKSETAFLVTDRGKPLHEDTTLAILKKLLSEAKIKTPAGLHTLRHSVATHLLQNGMKLENIALFLGHKSLDSTQVYTHTEGRSSTPNNETPTKK